MNEEQYIAPSAILTRYFPETKQEQQSFVEQLVQTAISGEVSPLKVEAQIKNIEDVVKRYRDDKRVKEALVNEYRRDFGEQKSADCYNARFTMAEVGVKYDYTACEDPEWEQLNKDAARLAEAKKAREEILKAHAKPWVSVNEETGEVTTIYPPVKTGKTQVTVQIL
jgi:viroplasmin and RNaseH domain-containing protein